MKVYINIVRYCIPFSRQSAVGSQQKTLVGWQFVFFFLLLLTFHIPNIFAQFESPGISLTDSSGYLNVSGYIEKNRKPLENSTIIIYEDNKKIGSLRTPPNGKFTLKLEYNKYFKVDITKKDLVTKKFEFDTHFPAGYNNQVVFNFDFTIVLFPKYDYIDLSILDKPLAIIKYQKRYKDFFYDYYYAKSINDKVISIQKKIETLIKEYSTRVDEGRKLLDIEQYRESLAKFERAHDIFPDETYPIEKIELITNILNNDKNKKETYTHLIDKAEENAGNKKYGEAIAFLEQASQVMPSEKYPQQRIGEIKKILDKIKLKESNYNSAIEKADKSFSNKNYIEAETYFTEAANIFPDRTYPKDRIAEIHKIQSEISKEALYNNAVREGDQFLGNSDYQNAISAYNKALSYNPNEEYPKERIDFINKKLSEISYIENAYKQKIADADELMTAKDYENAKIAYSEANMIKPLENYPKDKILEIDKMIENLISKEDLYKKAIADADKKADNREYQSAIEQYKNALKYKPDEKYPELQIYKLNNLISKDARNEAKYIKIISIADRLTKDKEYPKAKLAFREALSLKPEEKYPREKIVEIDKKLSEEEKKVQTYWNLIEAADECLDIQDFDRARGLYLQASKLIPDDKYAREKAEEVSLLLVTKQSYDEAYSRMIVAADLAMSEKEFEKAMGLYLKASEIKPEETYTKKALKNIEDVFKGFESNKILYNSLILEADDMYDLQNYKEARDIYRKACEINPIQRYPKERISEINKLLLVNEYDKAIGEINNELIERLTEKKFTFIPLINKQPSNYIMIISTNLSQQKFKALVCYGKDDVRSGGFEVDLKKQDTSEKYIVRVGTQKNWLKQQNNWISIQPIGGDIEVNNIQIIKGE